MSDIDGRRTTLAGQGGISFFDILSFDSAFFVMPYLRIFAKDDIMDTKGLAVLFHAAAAGSLSGAARRLGLTPLVASRRLAALEQNLSVRLMNRTTRSISLTPEGEALLPYAEAIMEGEAAIRGLFSSHSEGASGLLRVTAPTAFGAAMVAPIIPALIAQNRNLKVELHLSDAIMDIVRDGFDIAIRIGDLRDSNLIAQRIGTVRRVLCASPEYLALRGAPTTVEELQDHSCLALTGVTHWSFGQGTELRRGRASGPFSCSSVEGLHEACSRGLGICLYPDWKAEAEISSGRLVEVMLDLPAYAPPIHAVYPSRRLTPPKLSVFLSALTTALRSSAR